MRFFVHCWGNELSVDNKRRSQRKQDERMRGEEKRSGTENNYGEKLKSILKFSSCFWVYVVLFSCDII
jgi:hypothetical protein